MSKSVKKALYKELVEDVMNCEKLDECNAVNIETSNKSNRVLLEKCEQCKEINLWSYWEGGIKHLNAKILVVGQDWGNYHECDEPIFSLIENREKYPEQKFCYMDGNGSATNLNLCRLFKSIGYDIVTDGMTETGDVTELFFTNLVLCYRKKGLTGGFHDKWITNCQDYFKRLVSIIEPKVIICLGRRVFDGVLKSAGEKVIKGSYNEIIEAGPIKTKINNIETYVFPLAHCGKLGTINRNRKHSVQDELEVQMHDWQKIKEYL